MTKKLTNIGYLTLCKYSVVDTPEVKIDPYQNIYKVINGTKNVTLHCTVIAANPDVNQYTWFKDGKLIDNTPIHRISDVSLRDDGVFVCSGRNDIGSTNSSELKIDVLCKYTYY